MLRLLGNIERMSKDWPRGYVSEVKKSRGRRTLRWVCKDGTPKVMPNRRCDWYVLMRILQILTTREVM